jgi:hypothetical protein
MNQAGMKQAAQCAIVFQSGKSCATRQRKSTRYNKKAASAGRLPFLPIGESMLGLDPLTVGDLALINAQAEAAIWIAAGPRFENHRSALLPIV